MAPAMGIVGTVLITRWSWLLLKDTARVLLDQQRRELEAQVKKAIEDEQKHITDLHIWSIGPNIHAAIVALVSGTPESPDIYRQRIQKQCDSLVHITVETQLDSKTNSAS